MKIKDIVLVKCTAGFANASLNGSKGEVISVGDHIVTVLLSTGPSAGAQWQFNLDHLVIEEKKSVQDLIDKFNAGLKAEKEAKQSDEDQLVETNKLIFIEKCKDGLGALINEFELGEVKGKMLSQGDQISYIMDLTFKGVPGQIATRCNKPRVAAKSWNNIDLEFKLIRTISGMVSPEIHLPADDMKWGAMFQYLVTHIQLTEEHEKQMQANRLQVILHDMPLWRSAELVNKKLAEAIEEFPDHATEIQKLASDRLKEIAAEDEAKKIEQLAIELRESEEEQLKRMVNYAWNRTFRVFKVSYGAMMQVACEDDEREVHVESFFTFSDQPLADGYWPAFSNGELTRRIKPTHIISVEIITIDGNQARYNFSYDLQRRGITIQSKNMTDVSINASLPPREIFLFDYDQVLIAIEKQDGEDAA